MNEVASWWTLSLALGCLCVLLAWPSPGQSIPGAGKLIRLLPERLPPVLYLTFVPLSLAATAMALSSWLTEQSVPVWLETISGYAGAIEVALSLQALCLLFHGKMYGGWVLLLLGSLSFQLWLFYQALGIDFVLLGTLYGAALFIFLAAAIAIIDRINRESRLAVARFLAFLLIVLQWLFTTGPRAIVELSGFHWLDSGTIYLTPLLMLVLISIGFSWQFLWVKIVRNRK